MVQTRRSGGAVPLLLEEAIGPDSIVAARALAALGQLAAPKDVPALVAVVLKTKKGPLRDEAERAVRQVCLQIANPAERAQPVLRLFQAAAPADRMDLLPLLGGIGGDAVRPIIQEALASQDPALYEAGVRAISNWPNGGVADQLLRLAQSARLPEHRRWALHAFVRVISLPGGATGAEKLAKLKQAMQLLTSDDERRWVIQRAAAVRTVETLRFLLPCLDQPALAEQTCSSVVELAHHKELRNPNLAEFQSALEKVLRTSRDASTRQRAKRYLEGN